MALSFYNSYRSVIMLARYSGLPLPWYSTPSVVERITSITAQAFVNLFLIYKLVCTFDAIFHQNTLDDAILNVGIAMLMLNGMLLVILYYVKSNLFMELINSMDNICDVIKDSRTTENAMFKNTYTADSIFLSKGAKLFASMSVISTGLYVFTVPLTQLIQGNYGERIAIANHCSFEFKIPHFYEVLLISEAAGVICPAMLKQGNEFIMFSLFKTQSAFFKYLSGTLKELAKTSNPQEKLKEWTKQHQAIIENGSRMIRFAAPFIVLYYIGITIMVAAGVFYQLNGKQASLIQKYFMATYDIILVSLLYALCYMAEEIKTEAENLSDALYRLPWYQMDRSSKTQIAFIMTMAKRPVSITAYSAPCFTMNKESFVSFMRSTISSYMGLSRILQLRE